MKLLYVSCHAILEYDELKMFSKFDDMDIFSTGAYIHPTTPPNIRPPLNFRVNPEHYRLYDSGKGKWNSPDLINKFDVIYFMYRPHDLIDNWNILKHKIVIIRMIGQSSPEIELKLKELKIAHSNLKIIRYSPKERNHIHYAGEDELIRFGKNSNEYTNWNGNINYMVSVVQDMKGRGDACGWDIFSRISHEIPSKLFGNSNEKAGTLWNGRSLSPVELFEVYKNHRVYFYTGTKPASYCLNFIEALMTGIPVVSIGRGLGNGNEDLYEIEDFIVNGENGFISDNVNELIEYSKMLLNDMELSKKISMNGRRSAISLFNEEDIQCKWLDFFKSL